LYLLDHDKKTVQDFCEHPGENYNKNIDDALKYTFAHDCCSHLPAGSDEVGGQQKITFTPKVGWFSKNAQTEDVGGRPTKIYSTSLQFRSLIRSDPHAKQTRIPRSLKPDQWFQQYRERYREYFYPSHTSHQQDLKHDSNSNNSNSDLKNEDSDSQDDPFKSGLVWESENVTRKMKNFDGQVWITDKYPISVSDFLTIVEIYSPTNQMWKYLQNYISSNLPAGFPIKLEVPVFYVLSALVEFKHLKIIEEDYETNNAEDEDAYYKEEGFFDIPSDYHVVQEAVIFGQESREMFKVVESNNKHKHKTSTS